MVLGEALRGMPRDGKIVAGLSAMYVWTWLLYWGGPYSLRMLTIELTNARWGVNVVACAVVVGVVVAAAWRGRSSRAIVGALRAAALVCGLVGTGLGLLLVLAPPADGAVLFAVAVASGFFTGATEGLLLCLWCTVTASFGMRAALTFNVAAMACSGAAFLLCNLVPAPVALAVGMLCPPAGYLCSRGRGSSLYEGAFASETSAAGVSAQARGLMRDRSFLMLAAIALIFGVSCGFVNASFEVVPKQYYWVSCYGVVIGTIFAAALTFLTAFLLKMDAWQLVFRTSLPLMAVAYLLFPYDAFWFVGPGIHALGYQYFFITLWSLLGSAQVRGEAPVAVSVALGLFAVEAGAALGLCLWNATCVGIAREGLAVVSSVAAFLILLAAVSFERPRFGWGDVRPGTTADGGREAERGYEGALARIRVDFGLSPREVDVCRLLARGRNRQFVARELGISLETAKSHATNVYRKLGVHSQQELLDVFESACDVLAREQRQ